MSLETKTSLIIGASGGIGQAVAKKLAEQGQNIFLCGRNETALADLKANLLHQDQHTLLIADVVSAQGREAIVTEVSRSPIDTIINVAGINQLTAFEQQTTESIEAMIHTNLTAIMLLTHDLIPLLETRSNSTLVNVGSTLGAIGLPGYVTYCASKFALRGFCEALSRELADKPINIKYFAPRTTETSINSDSANAMNTELGNKADSTQHVANELIRFLETDKDSCHLGWPEQLFVKVNAVLPSIVSQQLKKQLPIVRKYIG
ncbi:SDR family oxidoreductase [Neptuniibacter marinus]|uniref:SDR family oxidoreductase n=1 Tax=Neptuniibacter marinus TaxID=1806670 RepID=UPI003B592613